MNDTQTGVASTPVQPVTLKFNKKYKKVTIPYDYWVGEFSGIDGIGLTINFGTDTTYLDVSTAEMGDVTLTSTTEADTITFAFEASGHSYVAARKISGLFVVIDSILAYTE